MRIGIILVIFTILCTAILSERSAISADAAQVYYLPFLDNNAGVYSVAFSSDGKYVLSGCEDKTVRLWETSTGRQLKMFKGHSSLIIESVAFSPDGKYVVSGAQDKTVKLWDVDSGRELRTLTGHTRVVYSVVFSPDGKYVVSGGRSDSIRLWDVATGRQIRRFGGMFGSNDDVFSVAFSPDGKYVASGSWDGTTRLWDVDTGGEIRIFNGGSHVSFSPDGKYILSGKSTIRLWDAASGDELVQLVSLKDGEWIALTPQGYFNGSTKGVKRALCECG